MTIPFLGWKGAVKESFLQEIQSRLSLKLSTMRKILASSLWGAGGIKSSTLNLDKFDSMKGEIRFEFSSSLFIVEFFTAKELANMITESGLGVNIKGEWEESIPKEGWREVSLWFSCRWRLGSIEQMEEE